MKWWGSWFLILVVAAGAELLLLKPDSAGNPKILRALPAAEAVSAAGRAPAKSPEAPSAGKEQTRHPVLDSQVPKRERRRELHRLTRDPAAFGAELAEIAMAPIPPLSGKPAPHSAAEMELKFERSLRISALESLDRLAVRERRAAELIREVYVRQSEPSLQFLAGLSLSGIEQGRPGKLTRFIDKVIDSAD